MVFIPDCRFPNEITIPKRSRYKTFTIRINRPDVVDLTDDHPSEISLDDWEKWDCIVSNDGRLGDLKSTANRIADSWRNL